MKLRLTLCLVVWGAEYRGMFLDYCLPSLLFEGNLSAVAQELDLNIVLYTSAEDVPVMQGHPAFNALRRLAPVQLESADFAVEPTNLRRTKYRDMNACHNRFLAEWSDGQRLFMFLPPDAVYAAGSFRQFPALLKAGKTTILTTVPRLHRDSFTASLARRFRHETQWQPYAPRELVAMALEHLHPEVRRLTWGAARGSRWPSVLYWFPASGGFLLRAFHLHPLVVQSPPRSTDSSSTIDGDFMDQVAADPDRRVILDDSDLFCAMEMVEPDQRAFLFEDAPHTVTSVAAWARKNTTPLHREFITRAFHYHSGAMGEQWEALEQGSVETVHNIVRQTVCDQGNG